MINNAFALGDTPVAAAPATQTSFLDKISNVVNKVVVPAANVYSQVKQASSSGQQTAQQPAVSYPWSTQTTQATNLPATAPTDNTGKYLLIGGAVVLGGLAIFFVTKKKGKK